MEETNELVTPENREPVERVEGTSEDPGDHNVRVGVVVDARLVGPRVGIVVLVGSHNSAYHESLIRLVKARQAREEPSDLQQHLGSV